jgi:hypothetical protein
MPRAKPLPHRRTVESICLTAIRASAGRLRILDRRGRLIAEVDESLAKEPHEEAVLGHLWECAFRGLRSQSNEKWEPTDPWEASIKWWARRQHQYDRPRSGKRFFSARNRKTWDDAIRLMRFQFENHNRKANLRERDSWAIWADTKARNWRRKEPEANGKHDRDSAADRCAGV